MIAVGIFQFSINCTFISFALFPLYLPTTMLISLYGQLDTTQSYLGRRNLNQGIAQILLVCTYNSEGLFWLMIEDQPTIGSTIPGEVGLVCVRRLTEHEAQSEPVNSIPLWILLQHSCLDFPQWWAVTWKCAWNKPFPSQQQNETKLLFIPLSCNWNGRKMLRLRTC